MLSRTELCAPTFRTSHQHFPIAIELRRFVDKGWKQPLLQNCKSLCECKLDHRKATSTLICFSCSSFFCFSFLFFPFVSLFFFMSHFLLDIECNSMTAPAHVNELKRLPLQLTPTWLQHLSRVCATEKSVCNMYVTCM